MTNGKDTIRNIGIASVAAVPLVGGSLAFLLDKYIPEENKRRQNAFILKLSDDIETLKDRIDVKNMETPEFKAIFMKLLSESIFEHREEKIGSFRNILLNVLLEENLDHFDKAEFFARLVMDLVPDEIKILNVFYQLDVKNIYMSEDQGGRRDIYPILMNLFNESNKEYIQALLTDCMRYNLISGSGWQTKKYGREGIFITELGTQFVQYVFEPSEVNILW